jgi:hypothetical protein
LSSGISEFESSVSSFDSQHEIKEVSIHSESEHQEMPVIEAPGCRVRSLDLETLAKYGIEEEEEEEKEERKEHLGEQREENRKEVLELDDDLAQMVKLAERGKRIGIGLSEEEEIDDIGIETKLK